MTVIEFFDKSPIENIISAFTICPEKIIFIGDTKIIGKSLPLYKSFLAEKSLNIEMVAISVNKNNVRDIVNKLSSIVEAEKECVFDLTGGEDLLLVAIGIVFHTYQGKKKIHMHRFNIQNGTVWDCDEDGIVPYCGTPTLSVKEMVLIYGGIVSQTATEDKTLLSAHAEDIKKIWDLCRDNPGLWNFQVGILNEFQKYSAVTDDPLQIYVGFSYASQYIKNMSGKEEYLRSLLNQMSRVGLIRALRQDGETLSFAYANTFVKSCVSKAGDILETKILQVAGDMQEGGNPYFCDAQRGVSIDWDGTVHADDDSEKDTFNEIDVILMRKLTPIFISCKNGDFDDKELYKLNTVSTRFGGAFAKKILVCSDFRKRNEKYEYLKQRAIDMNIQIIEDIHEYDSDKNIQKKLKAAIS